MSNKNNGNYENIEEIDSYFRPYMRDALKERGELEVAVFASIRRAHINSAKRVIDAFLLDNGKNKPIKPLTPFLERFIDEEQVRLNDELVGIVETAIMSSVITGLSPLARLKLDAQLFEMKTGESLASNDYIDYTSTYKVFSPFSNPEAESATEAFNRIYRARRGFPKEEDLMCQDAYLSGEKGKEKADSVLPRMKSIQKDMIAQAREIAKSTMHKLRVFDGKEFKLSEKLWGEAKKTQETLKKVIKENINKDSSKCAKAIETYAGKGRAKACKDYPDMMKRLGGRVPGSLDFASYRLARNEMAETTFRATLEDYKDNKFVAGAKWLLANNRLKKYENTCSCNELAYTDSYGLGRGVYPLEKVPERPHVMCLCSLAPISSRQLRKAFEKGMKLGNVPPEDWLESLKEEKGASAIKDASNQYALTLFQNEDEKTIKKECIEVIREHEWFNTGVKDIDKETFIEDLNKLTKEGLFILARYTGTMQAELYYEGREGSHYHPLKNQIYCNLSTDAQKSDNKVLGYKLGMKSFLHETGHWLDSNITGEKFGVTSKMGKLYNTIQRDVINFINKVGREQFQSKFHPISKLDATTLNKLGIVKQYVADKIKENIAINSNISDIYGAVTQNTILGYGQNGRYGHPTWYWQYADKAFHKAKVKMEFIAESFESLCNSKRADAMQKFLPNAWKEFNSEIRNFIKGGKK